VLIPTSPNAVTFLIIGVYLAATVAIGYWTRRNSQTAQQFLHARGMLPTAVTSIAFLAANCGALEIVGIVAASAKYGMLALHFYWIGAIPAMVFLALFMMPIYARSRAMTVPDFLRIRYNDATQILSAVCLAAMMSFISGISLYAIGTVLHVFFGWSFFRIIAITSSVVLCYVLTGGLKATIYNEVMQLALTIAGLVPLVYAVLHDFRGLHGLVSRLPPGMTHVWSVMPLAQPRTATMDVVGVVFGLGFVLSCGYWCTDFVLIQRALAARDVNGSIRTPLFAAVAKVCFPVLVVIPGLAAATFSRHGEILRYDQALPFLMRHYYGRGLLGLGISAILASLMSGLAGNINALATLWTHDLYRGHIRKHERDSHYIAMGRAAIVVATGISIATAYIALRYNNLMDYLQLLFALFNAPLFATFLLGMFTTWATPEAGFYGLLAGLAVSVTHTLLLHVHLLTYGSDMSANFYGAIYAWVSCFLATVLVSLVTRRKSREELAGVTYFTQKAGATRISAGSWLLAGTVLAACLALNIIFR
jgi:SSS family solute:Na+ symporter